MSFGPQAIRGADDGAELAGGQITYRLARNSVVSEFTKGRLSKLDVCDAHPELIRAAKAVGEKTTEVCPICDDTEVVMVSYAFGPGLPAHGKLISSPTDLSRATRTSSGDVACYVVEVCPGCSWNHLSRTYVVNRRRRSRA